MATATYKKLVDLHPAPQQVKETTPDTLYWSSFRNQTMVNHLSPITSTSSSPSGLIAITTNARLLIYASSTATTPKKTISRFKDQVLCSVFRADSRIVAAGDASGLVQLFDIESRSILRSLRGHTGYF
jgi:U3 small nucleolar RNA-associated protein 15